MLNSCYRVIKIPLLLYPPMVIWALFLIISGNPTLKSERQIYHRVVQQG